MSLLLDENLSRRLASKLVAAFPGTKHISDAGLESASDQAIYEFAKVNALCIVSKDRDFVARTAVFGWPPKVIWLRLGNCATADVETALLANVEVIRTFLTGGAGLLVLPPGIVLEAES